MPRANRGGARAAAGAVGGVLTSCRRAVCVARVMLPYHAEALRCDPYSASKIDGRYAEADSACARDDTQLLDLLHRAPRVLMRKRAA